MQGLAQKMFSADQKNFWSASNTTVEQDLFQRGYIQAADLIFAKWLAKECADTSLNLLWIYLFAASRQGHLCVQVDSSLSPKVEEVFYSDTDQMSLEEIEGLSNALQSAFSRLCEKKISSTIYVKIEKNTLALERCYYDEQEVFQSFYQLLERKPHALKSSLDISQRCSQEQKKAIETSLSHSVSFITGGPGVGKTFTASHLIQSFTQSFERAQIALVAPTGRAAAHLQSAFISFLDEKSTSYDLKVFTLHKLLSLDTPSFFPFDLILVDESSMIGLRLMKKLLSKIKPHSRLIFLGDPHQLPPVDNGCAFKDLISLKINVSHLTECRRVEKKDLIDLSQQVLCGDYDCFLNRVQQGNRYQNLPYDHVDSFYHEQIKSAFALWNQNLNAQELFLNLKKQVMLSALKKGPFGVDRMNQVLQSELACLDYRPIMILQNDYLLELFNGDVGLLFKGEVALFPVRAHSSHHEQSEIREIPASLLPSYSSAYCLSVHKSQGSEYGAVTIILPKGSEVFGRSLLYTAMTRAKKSLEIFSDPHTLQKCVQSNPQRTSRQSLGVLSVGQITS